jgi:hypothetical protein
MMEAERREREERAQPFYGTSRYYAAPLALAVFDRPLVRCVRPSASSRTPG